MRLTLNKRTRAVAKKSAMADDLSANLAFIMSIEEAQLGGTSNYTETMSRWSREVLSALETNEFWVAAGISFIVSEPWRLFPGIPSKSRIAGQADWWWSAGSSCMGQSRGILADAA